MQERTFRCYWCKITVICSNPVGILIRDCPNCEREMIEETVW